LKVIGLVFHMEPKQNNVEKEQTSMMKPVGLVSSLHATNYLKTCVHNAVAHWLMAFHYMRRTYQP